MNVFRNFLQRSVSGLIFISIVILSILWNPYAFGIVFLLVTFFGLYEFYKLTYKPPEVEINTALGIAGGLILFTCSFFHAYDLAPAFVFSFYAVWALVAFIAELFLQKPNPVNNWANLFLGQIYIALPFSLLNYIIFIQGYQPLLLLAFFIVLWANDTGAYVTGMLIGRHKMFERVSPKKTWEGFFGGTVLGLISGYVLSRFIPDISLWQWIAFSLLVTVSGTLGDLCESLLKRTENVKDAGKIIPGHGGILDRFDSTLIAAPAVLILLTLILKIC